MNQLNDIEPAFVCTVCAKPVRSRFMPDIAPKCPSCGAATKPAERALSSDVHAFCAHCHYEGPAYSSRLCPKCGSYLSGFPGHRPEASQVAPDDFPKVVKQGPSGGIKIRPRKSP